MCIRDRRYCDISSQRLNKLADKFWPGPLTIVLPVMTDFPKEINNGSGYLGVRVPNHSFTQKIIESLGRPITGTSANISGVAPTKDINQIKKTFSKKVSEIRPMIAVTKLDECWVGAEEFSSLAMNNSRIGIVTGTKVLIDSIIEANENSLTKYMKENFKGV